MKKSSGKVVRYNKWGYIFLIPFIVVYVNFSADPISQHYLQQFL
mgnify:CR=1 FL=1